MIFFKKLCIAVCIIAAYLHADCCMQQTFAPFTCTPLVVDYVIVGAGMAGCVLAKELSDGRKSVIVLDMGGNNSQDPEILSIDQKEVAVLSLNSKYARNREAFKVQDPVVPAEMAVVYGQQWGGSSAIGNLFAARPTPAWFERVVAATGDATWDYATNLEFMKELELYTGTSQIVVERGANGPLSTLQSNLAQSLANPFNIALSAASGAAQLPDYNVSNGATAVTALQQWIRLDETRSYAANAFLDTSVVTPDGFGVNGRRLRIISPAQGTRILFDTSGPVPVAIGLEYIDYTDPQAAVVKYIYAREAVILAAEAIGDVKLLQQSGIGPADVLTAAGIPVLVDSPRVGKHLQIGYGTECVFQTKLAFPALPEIQCAAIDCRGYYGFPADSQRRALLRYQDGTQLFTNAAILDALQFNPAPGFGASMAITIANPASFGQVFVINADPQVDARVEYNLFSDSNGLPTPGSDMAKVLAVMRTVRSILPSGLDFVYPTPAQFANDTLLAQAVLEHTTISGFPVGTCAMGTDITNGVVDANFGVFGVKRLCIADASVEPLLDDGDTLYADYMIGKRFVALMS